MAMLSLLSGAPYQPRDLNGAIVPGGKLTFTEAGTTTPQDTYTDALGTVPHTNPVLLDGAGYASIYLAASPAYDIAFTDAADAPIWTQTNVTNSTGIALMNARRVTLTNAQIKALPITPVEIVPAVGVGFRPVLHLAALSANFVAGAYTNLNAAGFAYLCYTSLDAASNYIANDATSSPVLAEFTNWLSGGSGHTVTTLTGFTWVTTPAASAWGNAAVVGQATEDNSGLLLTVDNNGAGALTGGNAANSLAVMVYYTVEPTV